MTKARARRPSDAAGGPSDAEPGIAGGHALLHLAAHDPGDVTDRTWQRPAAWIAGGLFVVGTALARGVFEVRTRARTTLPRTGSVHRTRPG